MPETLSLKQLQDAENCCRNPLENDECVCGLRTVSGVPAVCVEVVARTAIAYRDMLKRLEWNGEINNAECCPICGEHGENGHSKNCELAALLKEA